MKPSNSFILLSSALLLQAAGAQERTTCTDFAALSAAAANCIATHNCTGLTDVNFGSDCDGKVKEHCAEIEACLECEEEIDALFDCENGAECGEGLLETCHEGHNEDHDHEVEGAATASNEAATATNGDGDHDEDHDEDHDSHDAEEAHDDHDEDHDDHDEDHSSHDGHGHDHSDEVKTMSKDPSSATIRRVVVAALALAAGSMIIA